MRAAAAAGLAGVGFLLLLWNHLARDASPVVQREPTAPAAAADRQDSAPAAGALREAVPVPLPEARAAEPPFDPSPVAVAPWLARFLVTDADERPIADATVSVWAVLRLRLEPAVRERLGRSVAYSAEHGLDALIELRTDAMGRASATLGLECVAAGAAKDGARSGQKLLDHGRDGGGETRFVLEAPLLLHGRAVREDGAPAAGAKITTRVNGSTQFSRSPPPQPDLVVADAEGRFTVPVVEHGGYDLVAELDGRKSFCEHCWIRRNAMPEVELVFPGALTLNGNVVDAEGAPVDRALVRAWREYRFGDPSQAADDYERAFAKTTADGRFSIAVRQPRRYQLLAAADGHATSEAVWVEPTTARPRVEVQLVLQRFATIGGIVRHADGRPFAGVRVHARLDDAQDGASAVPSQRDCFQDSPSSLSDADGRFALTVHPGSVWTVVAWPFAGNHCLFVATEAVRPGTQDLEIVIRDEDLHGCVVRGDVVTSAGGALSSPFDVVVATSVAGKPHGSDELRCGKDGNRFQLPLLPLGGQFVVTVFPTDGRPEEVRPRRPGPFAPVRLGPFTATREPIDLHACVSAWGEMPVRVLSADGVPARGLVRLRPEPRLDVHDPQGWLDANGAATLKGCVPGTNTLWLLREDQPAHTIDVTIQPGLGQELVMWLPVGRTPTGGR